MFLYFVKIDENLNVKVKVLIIQKNLGILLTILQKRKKITKTLVHKNVLNHL